MDSHGTCNVVDRGHGHSSGASAVTLSFRCPVAKHVDLDGPVADVDVDLDHVAEVVDDALVPEACVADHAVEAEVSNQVESAETDECAVSDEECMSDSHVVEAGPVEVIDGPPCSCGVPSMALPSYGDTGRPFYKCSRPHGEQCSFFQWFDEESDDDADEVDG